MSTTMLPPAGDGREVHAYADDEECLPGIVRGYEARGLEVAGWADGKGDGMGPREEESTWRP